MGLQSTYNFTVAGSTTVEITKEKLGSLLSQIEAELHSSEVYSRALAGLQTMLGEAAGSAQLLIKAVGQEAIKLAFHQFARQSMVVPVAPLENDAHQQQPTEGEMLNPMREKQDSSLSADLALTEPIQDNRQFNGVQDAPTNSSDALKPQMLTSTPLVFPKLSKKLSKAEIAAQKYAQEREEAIRYIGQQLQQARIARSLSVRQLYNKTLVQTHHIEALETGCVDKLPEDIYIKGFIRRIGYVLGLDGAAMADALPAPDPNKSILPSWYRSTAPSLGGIALSPVHLYVGYAALVAGAVGGLALMSNQSASDGAIDAHAPTTSDSSVSKRDAQTYGKPGLKASKAGVKAGSDIAPPESF
ncbi:helix-turn-helix domain-containing protein [Microcoleus sp. FACHB-831]|uniref:helix-turn-helix domain-containing protein n=1 Tax=Microcoleus sp. FACHB-831 TaxID=2692827 RepID=UPI0016891CF0|nr:helix-turn-helix domain-containing protein [Microcoleus sp. FACHB-831]MBD1924373.1 helix-turn-helix domain-containing protein [Microcoleus sp. FACHB-831]